MDQVNPNPPKEVVPYPERCGDDISNQPLPDLACTDEENAAISFSDTSKKSKSVQSPKKRPSTGKKRPLTEPLPPPDPKSPKLDQPTPTQSVNKAGSPSVQPHSNNAFIVLHTVILC